MNIPGALADAGAAAANAARTFTMKEVPIIDTLVDDLPRAKQLALGRQMLQHPEVHGSPAARGPLALIKQAIAPIRSPNEQGEQLLGMVRTNIDTEIQRIDGLIPSGGYDGHPDYAAVGQVIEGLDLLERFGAFARL